MSASLNALAEQLWQNRPSGVFNGSLLAYVSHTLTAEGIILQGAFTEYKFYYAQKNSVQHFGVASIGVSGVIICDDHFIIARRSPTVTGYAGWLELVPSGSIDREMALDNGTVNFTQKLREEFTEETGVSADHIQSVTPIGVIHDPQDPAYDAVCAIHVTVNHQTLIDSLTKSDEYTDPLAIPKSQALAWSKAHRHELLPTSRAIIEAFSDTT